MNGHKARDLRRIWSFFQYAKASRQVVCRAEHYVLKLGDACPSCRATV